MNALNTLHRTVNGPEELTFPIGKGHTKKDLEHTIELHYNRLNYNEDETQELRALNFLLASYSLKDFTEYMELAGGHGPDYYQGLWKIYNEFSLFEIDFINEVVSNKERTKVLKGKSEIIDFLNDNDIKANMKDNSNSLSRKVIDLFDDHLLLPCTFHKIGNSLAVTFIDWI